MTDFVFRSWLDRLANGLAIDSVDDGLSTLRGQQRDEAASDLRGLGADPEVRAATRIEAGAALAAIGETADARSILVGIARNEPLEPEQQAALGRRLRELLEPEDVLALAGETLPAEDLRVGLASSAAALGTIQAARALLLRLCRDEALLLDTRVSAATALAAAGRSRLAARELVALARGTATSIAPDFETRRRAFEGLRELRRERELIALAEDVNEFIEVRVPAAESLFALNRADRGREILLRLARESGQIHWDYDIVAHALEGRGLVQELVDLTREPDINLGMRAMAVYVLSNREHVDRVLTIARDLRTVPDTRVTACSVLESLGWADESVEILVSLVRDREIGVEAREEAAVALRGPERADLLLELALESDLEPTVRCSCMYGLVELRDGQIARTLEQLSRTDPETRIREAAAFTAGEIRTRQSAERWRRWTAPLRAVLRRGADD